MTRFDGKDLSGASHAAVGDRLGVFRDVAGLNVCERADAPGVGKSNIRTWEGHVCGDSEQDMSKVASTLGVSPSWLLTGCGDGPSVQDPKSDMVNFLRWELERLERMHDETATMIEVLHRRIADIEQDSNL